MPRHRERTTTKGKWTKEELAKAVEAVSAGNSLRSTARKFGIPFSTLQDRIKKNVPITGPSLGRHSTFSAEVEKGMAENIKLLAKLFYGLSPLQVRNAAFIYAEKHNIKHNFNRERKLAGKDWLYGFFKRNPSITIRQPEATSMNRVTAFNIDEVKLFFQNLEDVMQKHQFTGSKVYNMDETGVTTVQDPGTIIAERGQKRVGSVTSYERGKNITVICAMSASGSYIPPMFIYPRQRMSPQLCKDGPAEAIYHCSKNGWTNEELFIIWLKHFVKFAKPSADEPVLLILDNHYSHSSYAAYMFCRENFIVVVSIPPHTSHRMQPLDVAFYGPLKNAFRKECDLFMKSHAMQKITPFDVASIFNKAYCNTATIQKGVSGFKASGIFPIDPNIFGEEDFLASNYLLGTRNDSVTVMDSPNTINPLDQNETMDQVQTDQAATAPEVNSLSGTSTSVQTQIDRPTTAPEVNSLPGPSATVQTVRDQAATAPEVNSLPGTSTSVQITANLSDITNILPEENIIIVTPSKTILSPLPLPKTTKRASTKQHSAILTATPMKEVLEKKLKKKEEKQLKLNQKVTKNMNKSTYQKTNTKTNKKTKKKTMKTTQKKNIGIDIKKRQRKNTISKSTEDFSSSDEEILSTKRKKLPLKSPESSTTDEASPKNKETCSICKEFGKNEVWYRCRSCGRWTHEECSGADSPESYVCDYCESKRELIRRLNL